MSRRLHDLSIVLIWLVVPLIGPRVAWTNTLTRATTEERAMAPETLPWSRSITVEELRYAYWIRVLPATLDYETSWNIRAACLRGLERGVPHIVVDLTGVAEVCADGIDMLEAAADELTAKRGTLWIANNEGESPDTLELRPVQAEGLSELVGLSAALDSAVASVRRLQACGDGDEGRRDR